MAAHARSIDASGLMDLALEARNEGATQIQNKVFAVLLKAALENHPHLNLRLYTNDRYGELDPEHRRRLLGIHHTRTGRRIRAPFELLTKIATEWVLLAIGDDDMRDLEPGRGYGGKKRPTHAQLTALEKKFSAYGVQVPKNMLENVNELEPAH